MESAKDDHFDSLPEQTFGFLEVTILILSVYVLIALLAQTLFPIPPAIYQLLDQIDSGVCLVFLADFVIRFRRAPSKLAFMRWGWIDLISSIPAYEFLRWGRLLRLIRIIRVVRAFRSARHLATVLYRHRTRSLGFTALLTVCVLATFSAIAILAVEVEQDSNIRTPFDALWWTISTMTTVGYGDKYPVTVEGKIVAMILMVAGVGLFGVLTGLFARLFVSPELNQEHTDIAELSLEIRALRAEIEIMQKKLPLFRDDRK